MFGRVSIFWIIGACLPLAGATPGVWKNDWAQLLQPTASPAVAQVPAASAPTPEEKTDAPSAKESEPTPEPSPEPVFITPERLLDDLRSDLVTHFELEGELVLMPMNPLVKIRVPDASWHAEVVPPMPATLGSRLHLRYRLTDGFMHHPEEMIVLRAEWWRDAYVSNRLLRAGELTGDGAYSIERINWLLHRGSLVPTDSDLSHLRLKTTWRANEPLRWSFVESRPLISEGSVVEVVATEGAMRITMRGVALENGHAGELINVRNLQSRKEIQGIVENENTVLVVF